MGRWLYLNFFEKFFVLKKNFPKKKSIKKKKIDRDKEERFFGIFGGLSRHLVVFCF